MRETIWLGLDVHANTITIAKLIGQAAKEDLVWTIPNQPAAIRRTFLRLKQEGDLRCCYEAGACGYELYRHLTEMEIECTVVAPSLIPSRPGDKVKTDRRDAVKLGRLMRAGELVSVRVPTVEQEEVRDLVRARESVRRDRTAARQRLGKFLLRHGRRYGATGWTGKHAKWLEAQEFTGTARRVFDHYREQVRYLDEQLEVWSVRSTCWRRRRPSRRWWIGCAACAASPYLGRWSW